MRPEPHTVGWFCKNDPEVTAQSLFDGVLREELKTWGYNDNEALSKEIENDCDFDAYHHIKPAFEELGLDTRAQKDGGPNATRGAFEFIVNSGGMIALTNVISPSHSAHEKWNRKPTASELPQFHAISDVAWGMWNRAGPHDKRDIKYFIVTQIMNETTIELITSVYKTLDPPQSEHKVWPGIEFSMETEAGLAILGSPVGRWTGYFLMQHKTQLGGDRYIFKVRIFKNEETGTLPYLCFYVNPIPAPDGAVTAQSPRA
ncbi:hypothetical protein J1614_004045 [Plenodomus biglobosus]|nr:hypothetical protein J1614_004045 [Plenodomus biglobosus]